MELKVNLLFLPPSHSFIISLLSPFVISHTFSLFHSFYPSFPPSICLTLTVEILGFVASAGSPEFSGSGHWNSPLNLLFVVVRKTDFVQKIKEIWWRISQFRAGHNGTPATPWCDAIKTPARFRNLNSILWPGALIVRFPLKLLENKSGRFENETGRRLEDSYTDFKGNLLLRDSRDTVTGQLQDISRTLTLSCCSNASPIQREIRYNRNCLATFVRSLRDCGAADIDFREVCTIAEWHFCWVMYLGVYAARRGVEQAVSINSDSSETETVLLALYL